VGATIHLPPTQMMHEPAPHQKIPLVMIVAAALAGAVLGLFEIANTSIGWHLASGDWILQNRAFLRYDPFSFTSGGAPWIDHEWLFQVGASIAYSFGGSTALVVLRALGIAVLGALLFTVSLRSGLAPPVALLLAIACVAGARGRYFVRPELVTLVITPAAVWLFLRRKQQRKAPWLVGLTALMVVGANAHGGVLVVPPLLAGILVAEVLEMALRRCWHLESLLSGLGGIAVSVVALLVNPYGWRLFTVPFRLSRLVRLDHIPNPEWVSPSPAQSPILYAALMLSVVVLGLRERRLGYWALWLMITLLALRHIRNVGLFFVLLPIAVAPALATWRALAPGGEGSAHGRRRADLLAVTAVTVLVFSLVIAPRPGLGLGFAENYYPDAACTFLDSEGLPRSQLYNDVRFGGYLIHRYFPQRLVFQDDRNEIHEPLLRRIWEIFQASDVAAWTEMLAGYDADTALVRYHPSIRVTDRFGNELGVRGFSALWFPADTWALVYWDDVAMVFVRRDAFPAEWLEGLEYRVIRPDDLSHLAAMVAADEGLRSEVARELRRAFQDNGGSRAHAIRSLIQ
jgi:hypothetical protein